MVDFNGFDKGVIGKKLPADTTLNCMRKSELIDLLHLAEENHRVLAEAYKIAIDTSKCNICSLHLDNRKVEDIEADGRRKCGEELLKIINEKPLGTEKKNLWLISQIKHFCFGVPRICDEIEGGKEAE